MPAVATAAAVLSSLSWMCTGMEPSWARTSDRPSLALITRTYHGSWALFRKMEETVEMFVPRSIPFIVVLDAEKKRDHTFGRWLLERGYQVHYEALPAVPFRHGRETAWPRRARYNRSGYQRQQWSSFYLDRYTDADVIGLLDTDVRMYSLLSDAMIYDHSGRILARGIGGDMYWGDRLALKEPHGEHLDVDFMYTDAFPMFFWRHTFPRVREHLADLWGTDFDTAFRIITAKSYNWQNIVYQYAMKHQPSWYSLRLANDSTQPTLTCGSHRTTTDADIMIGCCRSFGVNCDCPRVTAFRDLILAYNHVPTAWMYRDDIAELYYHSVQIDSRIYFAAGDLEHMKDSCRRAWAWYCKPQGP